jgi:putative heme-binding domain-containing protein
MARWLVLAVAGLATASVSDRQPRPLDPLVEVLAQRDDVALHRDVLRGMAEALAGRRSVRAPAGWPAVYRKLMASSDDEVRERTLALSVLFGDPQALAELRRRVKDVKVAAGVRERALQTLVDRRAPGLPRLLHRLLDDGALRRPALRGLAAFDDAATPRVILGRYPTLKEDEKADALATLASRPAYALELLAAMEKKAVPTADLSAYLARQIVGLNDARVTPRLAAVWGTVRPAGKDKEALLAKYRKLATPNALKNANRGNGRALFAKHCASCHVLFGEGGKIGPELTGAQRANPEYILGKLIDPNAVVARDYQVTRVVTVTGRIVVGLVKEENDRVLTLQTPTEVVRVPKGDIEERQRQPVSLMPEGLLAPLKNAEVRDLLAYLAGPGPGP